MREVALVAALSSPAGLLSNAAEDRLLFPVPPRVVPCLITPKKENYGTVPTPSLREGELSLSPFPFGVWRLSSGTKYFGTVSGHYSNRSCSISPMIFSGLISPTLLSEAVKTAMFPLLATILYSRCRLPESWTFTMCRVCMNSALASRVSLIVAVELMLKASKQPA